MGKSKISPRAMPSDDRKVVGTAGINITSIAARQGAATPPAAAEPSDVEGTLVVEPHLVVFGLDDSGKAHASKFGVADAELAIKAAGAMGFYVLPITTDEHRAAASGLAAGRVFASGRCFAPFAKMAAYEALKAFGEAYQPPAPPEPLPEPEITIIGPAANWADIAVGNLVLAAIEGDEQWWPSLVAEAPGEDLFVLRWVGYPDEPAFVRRRDNLGLLPPTQAAPEVNLVSTADPAA